jgi:hypothetical protein
MCIRKKYGKTTSLTLPSRGYGQLAVKQQSLTSGVLLPADGGERQGFTRKHHFQRRFWLKLRIQVPLMGNFPALCQVTQVTFPICLVHVRHGKNIHAQAGMELVFPDKKRVPPQPGTVFQHFHLIEGSVGNLANSSSYLVKGGFWPSRFHICPPSQWNKE